MPRFTKSESSCTFDNVRSAGLRRDVRMGCFPSASFSSNVQGHLPVSTKPLPETLSHMAGGKYLADLQSVSRQWSSHLSKIHIRNLNHRLHHLSNEFVEI